MSQITLQGSFFFALRIALLFIAVLGFGLYFFQEKLIFHGQSLDANYQFRLSLPFEERTIESGTDQMHSLLVRAPKYSRGLLLYFHGNAGSLEGWSEVAEDLADKVHWDVLIVDYPGFGKSPGSIRSEEQLHALAEAAFAAAKLEAKGRPLAVMGRSIGTGLAVRLASRHEISGLVLESPYVSLKSLARLYFPFVPPFLLRYSLNSASWMPDVKAPTLVLHGTTDEVIPFSQGQELAALDPKARFVAIPGGHHNDLAESSSYWPELTAFFDRVSTAGMPQHRR